MPLIVAACPNLRRHATIGVPNGVVQSVNGSETFTGATDAFLIKVVP
jgi:hypothetical protein